MVDEILKVKTEEEIREDKLLKADEQVDALKAEKRTAIATFDAEIARAQANIVALERKKAPLVEELEALLEKFPDPEPPEIIEEV